MVTTELCIEAKLHTHSRDSRELCISFPFETAYVIFLYLTASTPHFMPQIMFHVSPFCHIVVHHFFSSFHTPFQNSAFSCFLTHLAYIITWMQLPRNRSKLSIRICSPVSGLGLWSGQETTASIKNIFTFAVLNKYTMDPIFLFSSTRAFSPAQTSFPRSIKLCLSLPEQFPGDLEFVGTDKNAIQSNQSYETLTRSTTPLLFIFFPSLFFG